MAKPIPPEHLPRILRGGVSIDEIEARLRRECTQLPPLRRNPRHINLGEPSKGEVRYLVAGIFAAIFALFFIAGAVL